MNRKQFCHLLVGGNGSGKTYTAIEIAIEYMRNNPKKRVLFILCDDNDKKLRNVPRIGFKNLRTFKGVAKIIIDTEKDFDKIREAYRADFSEDGTESCFPLNGLIVCDDLGSAMPRRPEKVAMFIKKRRQINADFLWLFHGWRNDVPPLFFTYINHIIIFQTSDTYDEFVKKIRKDKVQEFIQLYDYVQKEAKKDPHVRAELVVNPLEI
jgi:hypothetical protein